MDEQRAPVAPIGPSAYANWRAFESGAERHGAYEVALYSDTRTTADISQGIGPYRFLNPVPHPAQQAPRLGVVVRCDYYLPVESSKIDWSKTDIARFHGGELGDELASLLALALGTRCRSGGLMRVFDERDPLGRPLEMTHRRPYLPPPQWHGAILPTVTGAVCLADALPYLAVYPTLTPDQAVSVARAASAFANALWIAEDDPASAWLILVAAVETAANERWRNDAPAEVRLEEVKPELVASLRALGGEDAVRAAAAEMVSLLKATSKFMNFALDYLPPPPRDRPEEWARLDWQQMKRHLGKVYDWRSRALHEGIPFPPPMCEPPGWGQGKGSLAETPGAPTATLGGVWDIKDIPMLLHTFVHIAGGILRNWWLSLGEKPVGNGSDPRDK